MPLSPARVDLALLPRTRVRPGVSMHPDSPVAKHEGHPGRTRHEPCTHCILRFAGLSPVESRDVPVHTYHSYCGRRREKNATE